MFAALLKINGLYHWSRRHCVHFTSDFGLGGGRRTGGASPGPSCCRCCCRCRFRCCRCCWCCFETAEPSLRRPSSREKEMVMPGYVGRKGGLGIRAANTERSPSPPCIPSVQLTEAFGTFGRPPRDADLAALSDTAVPTRGGSSPMPGNAIRKNAHYIN
jgi:hypothetical protein